VALTVELKQELRVKSNAIVLAAMVGGVVVAGATWFVAPMLAPPSRKVASEAGLHVERGRRILHEYNAQLAYGALVRNQLRNIDFDVDLEDTSAIEDEGSETYEEIHGQLWDAFKPTNWGPNPRQASANYGNIVGQARRGVQTRDDLVKENARLLDDALAEANAAIAVTSGDATGRDYAEAHRLRAVALYHKALTERLRSAKTRADAEQVRQELLTLTRDVVAVTSSKTLTADSKVDERIATVQNEIEKGEARLSQYEKSVAAVDAEIKAFEERLADASSKASVAFNEMQRMQNEGVDFTDAAGSTVFTNKLMALADAYGIAVREAHIIEFGGYPDAEIDYTGDYIRGRYVQGGSPDNVTMTLGLTHAQQRRGILAAKVQREMNARQGLRDDLALLEKRKASYEQMEMAATKTVDETTPIANEAYDELNQIEAEAVAIEDSALAFLDKSMAASKQAAGVSGRWASDASSKLSSVSAEAQGNSALKARSDDQWIAGFNNAQVADAQLAKAAIYLSRYKESTRTASVLGTVVGAIKLNEVDVAAEKEKASEAREAGVAAVTDAASILERAHRTTGRHWTLVAQAATANEMLVQFGLGDYVADALAGYRNAIKGREDESFSKPFADRIRRLEDR
jgi:uncharacterized small protein (DUF1192 family)